MPPQTKPVEQDIMIRRKDWDVLVSLGCVVLEADLSTFRLTDASAAVEDLFGVSREECRRGEFVIAQFIHPADYESVVGQLARLFGEPCVDFHFRGIRTDGEIIRLRGRFALSDHGSDSQIVCGLVTEFHEITEFESVAEERLQLALDAASMGIWDWNVSESKVFWSEQVYRLHDYTREEVGNLFENYFLVVDRIHPHDVDEVEKRIRGAMQSGEDYDLEYRFELRAGGYRWLQVKGRIYPDNTGSPARIAGTAQDITARKNAEIAAREELLERKRAEAELTALTENLERRVAERTSQLQQTNLLLKDEIADRTRAEKKLADANRRLIQSNRELQDFAYIASHDLKEPLRKISTFADLLLTDYSNDLNDDGLLYLTRVQDSASRMLKLINDLLQFSRVKGQGTDFTMVDLNEVAAQVLSDIEVQVKNSNATVRVGRLPSIPGDATQMRQLLQNLVSNAVKFRREGVDPEVQVYAADSDDSDGDDSPFCRLIVEDNGIGFDEQYSSRIFVPFQRLHQDYDGTGIGLAICRRIVERHRGSITVNSRPGSGSRFIIELPFDFGGDEAM